MKKEFHISRRQKGLRWILALFFLFSCGFLPYCEFISLKNGDLFWAYFWGPGTFILSIYCLVAAMYSLFFEKIITTQDGFEYISFPNNHLCKKWDDIHHIGIQRSGFRQIEGIYIKKSKARTWKMDFVPLSYFSDNWRVSELGQQIKQYAPHLFE